MLRRAGPGDVAAVRELSRAAYARWVPLIGREPLPMTADYERAVARHIIDLAEEDGRLLGLVEVIPLADHLHIENIAVRPGHQGRGLGSSLLSHAEDLARSLGHDEVRLFTNAAFAANIAFYARRGYEEHGRERLTATSVLVFMRKRLVGTPPG